MMHNKGLFRLWTLIAGAFFLNPLIQELEADDNFAPMFPFVISYDGPDNASSVAHLLDAPAGKYGFVRVADGHFVTDAGPIRFHATNLTGPANFPEHADADKLANRLARLGINCVRLHFMDTWYTNFMPQPTQAILANDTETQRNLDPKQLDKLDYMIAAFKNRGIYVNMNLHVGRTLDERDGFDGVKHLSWANKGIGQILDGMIELQKEYARKLLTHVNAYTGNAYTDEPAVAMIEISNEDGLTGYYYNGTLDRLPEPYASEVNAKWNEWLHAKYANASALQSAWTWKNEPLRDEQIPEGRFDKPVAFDDKDWSFRPGDAQGSARVEDGALKVTVTRNGNAYDAKVIRKVSLKKGQLYTLSVRIRRTEGEGAWRLSLAMASVQNGWSSVGLQEMIPVGKEWKTVNRVFEATEDDAKAILQLTQLKVGKYELDDFSLQRGAELQWEPVQGFDTKQLAAARAGDNLMPPKARLDYVRFLFDLENAYWTGMAEYVRNELKAKPPISGTQLGYSPPYIQAKLDYVDIHGYWHHPRGGWISLTAKEPWKIGNTSMVNSLGNILSMGGKRVLGKPYTISEYNHPYPNQFGAEAQPMLAIYGSLQGWDGIFQYSYNHYVNDFEAKAMPWCFFDLIARTDALAHFPACSAIFVRGDVRQAKELVPAVVDEESCREYLVARRSRTYSISSQGYDGNLVAVHRTGVKFAEGSPATDPVKLPADQKVFVSDTGEITWNKEIPGAAYLAVNTPNTKLFTGFPKERTIELGDVTLKIGKTRLDWTTVSLVSRNATGFGSGGRDASILLAATGDAGNAGRVLKQVDKTNITLTDRGHAPMMVEGIPATLTLPSQPAKTRCYALDTHGDRMEELPVKEVAGGSEIVIGPQYKTVWYEVEIR